MKKTHQIVLIETDKESNIIKGNDIDYLVLVEDWSGKGKPQHLYVLLNDEIKKDDWYCHNQINCLRISNSNTVPMDAKKIIATTDKSLTIRYPEIREDSFLPYPQIPQSFIEYYIEQYNKGQQITEIDVEYVCSYCGLSGETITDHKMGCDGKNKNDFKLSLNSNNTINIYPIKISWNRKEVEELLYNVLTSDGKGAYNMGWSDEDANEWIKQNL